MFYKIGKKFLQYSTDLFQFIRLALVFLAFATTIFWLFYLANAPFATMIAPFFEPINNFVHTFYTRKVTIDAQSVDFSYLIGAIVMILMAWGIKFIVELLQDAEKRFDIIHEELKRKSEQFFNLNLEMEHKNSEYKYNKFLILIKLVSENKSKDKLFTKDFDDGVKEKQKQVLYEFCQNMENENIKFEKKKIEDKALLYFNNFEKIDAVLAAVEKSLIEIKTRYKKENWEINFISAIEVYSNEKEVLDRYKTLAKLISLNFKNEIICLATFKSRYSLIKNPENFIENKGTYKLEIDSDIFCIKSKKTIKPFN